jgi:prepilin-type N-terminal cleavage/methylation domain-containing protein
MKPSAKNGFTLLEMLVVIAIIGIIAAIGFVNYNKTIKVQRLREAQGQFTQAIERARTLSRRYSQDYRLGISNKRYRIVPLTLVTTTSGTGVKTSTITEDTASDAPPSFAAEFANGVVMGTGTALASRYGEFNRYDIFASTNPQGEGELQLIVNGPNGRIWSANQTCFVMQYDSGTTTPKTALTIAGVTGKVVSRGIFYNKTSTDNPCP